MKSIEDTDVTGKKVLLRADLDGPVKRLGKGGGWESVDEPGLEATLPTIRFLVKEGAKTIIIGHLGRPGGKVVESLRLDPVAKKLSEYLEAVHKTEDCVGPEVKEAVEAVVDGDILLLENLRFHKGEEGNDPEFAQGLALLADIFVNDAFAVCHRQHASIVGIPKHLPSFAGLRLLEEVTILRSIISGPKRPLVFIIGGTKLDKIPLVKKLSKIADRILLGGLLGFSPKLEGIPKVVFPVDALRTDDIGPKTAEKFSKIINEAKTVIWNGPMGRFEDADFAEGTRMIADAVSKSQAFSVAGGGDTIAALKKFNLLDKMDWVSSGGGAMLTFLAEGTLPGLKALNNLTI